MMRFGLQKMTLLDYPGKVACTVFTNGCDFRCPFCHNASLVDPAKDGTTMSGEELLEFLAHRTGILEGVCITGGEPLMHRDELFSVLAEIRSMDYPVKLDTNGSYPEALKTAVDEGLVNYVAMDVKNTPEKYAETAGFQGETLLEKVRESVAFLLSGEVDYEFRTTVVRNIHRAEDFAGIGKWIQGCRRYFLQKFVDSGDVLGDVSAMGALSDAEMQACLQAVQPWVPNAALRGVE